jgi:hypothetical protein
MVLDLIKREEELLSEVRKIRTAIAALQDICKPHDWVDDGHDSHKRYVKCTKCGKKDWD